MRILSTVFALLLGLGLMTNAEAASERYGEQKVVYHINYTGGDANKAYKGAMKNIQNHINAVGAEKLDIKVVLHGNGLGLLMAATKDSQMAATVDNLKMQNVSFGVCANTLRGRKIDKDKDLYDVVDADVIPSGVAELSHLQQMGYTYIKP